jgi:hypothetical protein
MSRTAGFLSPPSVLVNKLSSGYGKNVAIQHRCIVNGPCPPLFPSMCGLSLSYLYPVEICGLLKTYIIPSASSQKLDHFRCMLISKNIPFVFPFYKIAANGNAFYLKSYGNPGCPSIPYLLVSQPCCLTRFRKGDMRSLGLSVSRITSRSF